MEKNELGEVLAQGGKIRVINLRNNFLYEYIYFLSWQWMDGRGHIQLPTMSIPSFPFRGHLKQAPSCPHLTVLLSGKFHSPPSSFYPQYYTHLGF